MATPTTVSAAGHTTASDARAPPSSGMPGGERQGDEQRGADGRRAGARDRHRGAGALGEDGGDDDGGRHRQPEGEQEAGRRAEPQHAGARLIGQHVARAVPGPAQHGGAAAHLAHRAAHARRARGEQRRGRGREGGGREQRDGRGVEAADAERDGREHHRQARDGLERRFGAEGAGERRPRGVPQLAPGEGHADRIAAARREDAAEPRAAHVPRAGAPARDVRPRRRQHAAPRDAPRDLPADVKDDGKHQPPDLSAGGSEHGANHSPTASARCHGLDRAGSARGPRAAIAGSAIRP